MTADDTEQHANDDEEVLKPTGYVRGSLLGSKLSTKGATEWHAWRKRNLKPLSFPVEGYDHHYGQDVIDAIDSTDLGKAQQKKRETHEYGSTKSPDDAPVGSLKDKWRLVPYFLQLRSLLRQHIDSYDYFVEKEMNDIVQSPSTREIKSDNDPNFFLRYEACWVGTPSIDEESFQTDDATPALCRWRDCTYSAPIYVTIRYTRGNQVVLKRKQMIGRLPIMLRSKKCVLYNKTEDEISALQECPLDPGGYFVVNGAEKVILIQEQLSKNRVILEQDSKGIVATITSSTRERKSKAYVLIKNGKLYLKHNTLGDDVPLVVAMKAMGMESDMEIVQLIADDPQLLDKMAASLEECCTLGIRTQQQALKHIGTKINTDNNAYKQNSVEEEAIEVLANVVIPHIPVEQFNFRSKCIYIGHIARRVLLVHLGRMPLDDKDFLGNKRLELAGSLLSLLFEDLFKTFNSILKRSAERILEKRDRAQAFDVVKYIRPDIITIGMRTAISTGNWVIKRFRMDRAGVTQVLTRLSYMSALGMMTKINSQFEKTRKISGPRALQPSQWGMLCPADTPEGEACGLVKSLALLSHVTTGEADTMAIERLCRDLGVEDVDRMAGHEINSPNAFLVFLNGQLLGVHTRPANLVRGLRTMRRRGLAGEFVSVYLHDEQKAVHIASDGGRVCRPLIIVDEETGLPKLKQHHVEGLANRVGTVKQLLQQGVVEYVDVNEENNTLIAITENALEIAIQEGLENCTMRYTHLEIDPFTVLGVVGGVIPFPHHNQAPRNTYTVAMAKQAMGCIALNMYERTDGVMYSLIYPQKPMSKSRILDLVGFDQIPGGQNSCIAVMSYSGYDIEDAIILNKASIDRGWGRCMVMRQQKTTIRRYPNGATDRTVGPPNADDFIDGVNDSRYKRYKGIDIDGICHVGAHLENGTILVNKESPMNTNSNVGGVNFGFGNEGMHSINYKPQPISYKAGAPSYVDRVLVTSNDQVPRLIKIMTRQVRRPEIGDKFASRHGQKGVCGLIVPEQDLPFNELGMSPDLIMNPHGFPSRMTVGKLLELLVGKAAIYEGRQSYSTAFGEEFGSADTAEAAAEALIRSGLNYTGKDVFYSGMSGEPLDAYIFSGPVFYQKLKHMVLDKIHARARGPRAVLTRQPMEGRAKDGGLRLGEMERDCLIAYAASNLLMERLMHSSDAFSATVCKTCGLLQYQNWCQYCHSGDGVTQIQLPYACKLLFQEMMSMNVIPRLRLEDQY